MLICLQRNRTVFGPKHFFNSLLRAGSKLIGLLLEPVNNNVCEYNRTDMAAENPRRIHPDLFFVELTAHYNGCLWENQRNTSQISVPRASTRCQQSLERVSGLFKKNELEFVVFLSCSHFGCNACCTFRWGRALSYLSPVMVSGILRLKFDSLFTY